MIGPNAAATLLEIRGVLVSKEVNVLSKRLVLIPCILLGASILLAQGWWESKLYTSWTKDEVTNMLDKSPWGTVYNRAVERISGIGTSITTGGGLGSTETAYDKLAFHLSFVTAKPIRMALARRALLVDPGNASKTDWGKYIDQEDPQNIVVVMSLTASPADSAVALLLSQTLDDFKLADLASRTFLSTDGGKKVALAKYDSLGENGYGVKFYFPRTLPDGTPLVAAANKEIRFDTLLVLPKERSPETKSIAVNAKWDLKKMVLGGKPCF
jgi:hypothetical protein